MTKLKLNNNIRDEDAATGAVVHDLMSRQSTLKIASALVAIVEHVTLQLNITEFLNSAW